MIHFAGKLNKQLNNQLEIIELEEIDISNKARKSIECIKNELSRLKTFIVNYSFINTEEEILFFKKIKPEVLSKLIYFVTILNIESRRPMGSMDSQIAYFKTEQEKLTHFFNCNLEFYRYHRMKYTFLDNEFFVRGNNNQHHVFDSLHFYIDPDFSTLHDLTVAQIIANDRLEEYLNAQIHLLSIKEINPNWEHMGIYKQQPLKWTESKTALVELIYALFTSGAINNGQCEIRELSALFESAFNIRLPDIYRTYLEIKIRTAPTKFIDSLKASLLRKIDEEFE